MRRFCLGVGLLVLITAFQNCNGVGFSQGGRDSGSQNGTGTPAGSNDGGDAFGQLFQGLKGGHFDLDTSSAAYAPSAGQTDHHVHEYDDKYGVTYADYFNLLDAKFKNINEAVPVQSRFVLVIANAQLSPGGVVEINGQRLSVGDYQKKVDQYLAGQSSALTVFTLDGSAGTKLSSLKIGFSPDALMNNGLIGTETGCVVRNDPGKMGEYRNGALLIQAIDVALLKLDPATRAAQLNGGLLWESTIFWHWDGGCYK